MKFKNLAEFLYQNFIQNFLRAVLNLKRNAFSPSRLNLNLSFIAAHFAFEDELRRRLSTEYQPKSAVFALPIKQACCRVNQTARVAAI